MLKTFSIARSSVSCVAPHRVTLMPPALPPVPKGPGSVLLILTLASPHLRPPLPSAHTSVDRFYAELAASPAPKGVPLISIAGGYNDTLVATELTHTQGKPPHLMMLNSFSYTPSFKTPHTLSTHNHHLHTTTGLWPPELSLHADTEAIPGVWASAYHDGIVWCNQLVVKLSALLRDVAIRSLSATPSPSLSSSPTSSWLDNRAATIIQRAEVALRGRTGRNLMERMMLETTSTEGQSQAQNGTGGKGSGGGGGIGEDIGDDGQDGERQSRDVDNSLPTPSPPRVWSVDEALAKLADRRLCSGANLAWFQQYNSDKAVKKPLLQLRQSSVKVWSIV